MLVSISQNFIGKFFPKKPEIIDPNKGKNKIAYSILTFQRTNVLNMN